VNLAKRTSHGPTNGIGASSTAEVATVQLEFALLSELTGDDSYRRNADRVVNSIDVHMHSGDGGLVGMYVDPETGHMR
jgi:mannosyl-oligosaccharide alpha-1,2-mannosidase